MKFVINTLILLVFISTVAAAPRGATIRSNWMSKSEVKTFIENKIDRNILVKIRGKSLLGDGVVYQADFQVLAPHGLVQQYCIGLTKKDFIKLNSKYGNAGFTLINSQSIQTMSHIVYQGVWHKSQL